MEGYANSIGVIDCTEEVFLAVRAHYLNDIKFMEMLLQKLALHELFFENVSNTKRDRYNRTLNLQWAIDLKKELDQIPN